MDGKRHERGAAMNCVRPVQAPIGNGQYGSFRCGKCVNCKLHKASEMAGRMLMAQLAWEARHKLRFRFVTVTYRDENRPSDLRDVKADMSHMVEMMQQALRRAKLPLPPYLACAEYGGLNGNAHGHLIMPEPFHTVGLWTDPKGMRPEHRFWDKGTVEVDKIRNPKNATSYLAGYAMKQDGQERLVWNARGLGLPEWRIAAEDIKRAAQQHGQLALEPVYQIGAYGRFPMPKAVRSELTKWAEEVGLPIINEFAEQPFSVAEKDLSEGQQIAKTIARIDAVRPKKGPL